MQEQNEMDTQVDVTKDRASEKATEKAIEAEANRVATEKELEERTTILSTPVAPTSVDAFLSSTTEVIRKGAVKTPSGFTLEIKGLDAGELALMTGSPLFANLVKKVAETGKAISPTDDDVVSLMGDPKFTDAVKSVVCMGVTSIPFVNKPEDECNIPDEIPIARLPYVDLMVTYKAITELSMGAGGTEMFNYFQGVVSESGNNGDQTPSPE